MRQAFYGEEVQRLPREGEDVRVMVRYPQKVIANRSPRLKACAFAPLDGREVPLTEVAETKFAPSFKRIERRDRQRTARVSQPSCVMTLIAPLS